MFLTHFRKLLPVAAFFLFGSVSVVLWQSQNHHQRELVFQHTEISAEQIRIRVEGLMKARMSSLEFLADRWVERVPPDFSKQRFSAFAHSFYTHYPGFTGINWIDPEGVIQWVYPEKENAMAKGKNVNHHDDPRYRQTFNRAKQHSGYVVTPCVELFQGGLGFDTFWLLTYDGKVQGYLNGVFEIKKIMNTCLARDILKNFWVRIFEADQLIYINEKEDDVGSQTNTLHAHREIHFPGKSWKLELEHKVTIYPTVIITNLWVLIFGLVISAILSLALHFLLERIVMYRKARDHAFHEISERKRAEEHIRNLSRQLMKAQEIERHRLARDLHDHLAQDLSVLKISLDTFFNDQPNALVDKKDRLSKLSKMVQQTIVEVRDLAYGLYSSELDQLGLVQAVHKLCEDFSVGSELRVDFFSAGMDEAKLDFDTEISLFRIIQEGLNNIKKHAHAAHVTVRLVPSYPNIILRIEDNGKGFDVRKRRESALSAKRMGIRSMEERAALLNGKMQIDSRLGQGTKIVIKVPFQEKTDG